MNLAWWLERSAWEHADKVAVMYGLLKLGAVFSGLNTKSVPDKLKRDVATCGARTLVVGREYLDAARALRRDTGIEKVLAAMTSGSIASSPTC